MGCRLDQEVRGEATDRPGTLVSVPNQERVEAQRKLQQAAEGGQALLS